MAEAEMVQDWLDDGTHRFFRVVADLADSDLAAPSRLPGWSRTHVIGHVARNADALVNLMTWASTGVETPMYRDTDQRAADIEESARQDPPQLRADLAASQARFAAARAEMSAEAWDARVRTASRRIVPAREVLWMRTREVWIHSVDLARGVRFADLPDGLVDALLDDATGTMSPRTEQYVHLVPADRQRSWSLGSSEPDPVVVSGTAADLLAWLIGRPADTPPTTSDAAPLPTLPTWL